MSKALKLQIDAGVATVTFNRPDVHNALSVEMLERLPKLLGELSHNSDVRCVVISGIGDKAFCAGGDISSLVSDEDNIDADELSSRLVSWGQAALLLHEMPKPTLAVVNGAAAGAGMAIALACDFRIASNNAKFTTAFSRLAMSGDFGGSYFLTHLVGPAKARELYFFSEQIDSKMALQLGIVNWLVNAELLADKVGDISRHLVAMPALTAKHIKKNITDSLVQSAAEIIEQESYAMIETALSVEARKAAIAFFDKNTS